jgi:hypothetical protein
MTSFIPDSLIPKYSYIPNFIGVSDAFPISEALDHKETRMIRRNPFLSALCLLAALVFASPAARAFYPDIQNVAWARTARDGTPIYMETSTSSRVLGQRLARNEVVHINGMWEEDGEIWYELSDYPVIEEEHPATVWLRHEDLWFSPLMDGRYDPQKFPLATRLELRLREVFKENPKDLGNGIRKAWHADFEVLTQGGTAGDEPDALLVGVDRQLQVIRREGWLQHVSTRCHGSTAKRSITASSRARASRGA